MLDWMFLIGKVDLTVLIVSINNFVGTYDPSISSTIIVWWTGFTKDHGTLKKCNEHECYFTVNRAYLNHSNTWGFIFYGSDLEDTNLPLPRQSHHEWALLHEESPKNSYLYHSQYMLELFNYTATFKRESHIPLMFQSFVGVDRLLTKKYLVSTPEKNRMQREEGLAPVVFVHSDCGVPSDRDYIVERLSSYIPIDSYGTCQHNKDLPEHIRDPIVGMQHEDFLKLLAKYKFTFYAENSLCPDYITEKFWRTLVVGSVPVVLSLNDSGRERLTELLPSAHSAVFLSDFASLAALGAELRRLNTDDEAYDKYLAFKQDGITNVRLPELLQLYNAPVLGAAAAHDPFDFGRLLGHLECSFCRRVAESRHRAERSLPPLLSIANHSHYGCPMPVQLVRDPLSLSSSDPIQWQPSPHYSWQWKTADRRAKAINSFVREKRNFTKADLERLQLDD